MSSSWKQILKFSIPVSLIGVADLLLIATDLFWVGLFTNDTEALTGIRLTSTVIVLIETVLIGVLTCLLIYVTQHFGAGNNKQSLRGIAGSFSFVIYAGIAISIVGFLIHPFISGIFGINDSTAKYLNDYLVVYFIGYIFLSLNNFLLLLPRYFQKVKIIFMGLGIAIVSNIILTPIIMYVFGQYNLSFLSAAAFGTIIANILCALFLIRKIFFKDYLELGLSREQLSFKLDGALLKENGAFIGSQIFTGLTFNVSMFIYMFILSFYPDDVLNTYSIATYVFVFFTVFSQNFATSLIPIVAQQIGQGKVKDIQILVKNMVTVLTVYGAIIAGVIVLARNTIAKGMATDPSLVPLFSDFFLYYSFPWVLNIISFIFIFVVSGAGDYKGGMYLTVSNMYIIVVALLLLLPKMFTDVTIGVFITLSIINVFTFANTLAYYKLGKWKKTSLVEEKSDSERLEAV